MTKIQNLKSLEAEMRAVARGEKRAPADAARPSFESVDALIRLLTPDNRMLLKTIRDARPQSIAELERLTGRKGPNLLRTLGKLAAIGLVQLREENRRTVPTVLVGKLLVEIDPYAMNDRVEVA
jgi:predicted transcriptional regulator